jgi:DNA-binding NtrC family response regulator
MSQDVPPPYLPDRFLRRTLADIERELVERRLEHFEGHRLKTAASLGISRRGLGVKLEKWGLVKKRRRTT